MGLAKRVIPCLDVDAGRVVKGVQFVNIKDAGDPVEVAQEYDSQGADEITFLDITASSDNRGILTDIISEVASQVFIPLTVGGGVRTVDDVRQLLKAGADKVGINTAAVNNPVLVRESVERFGSQCIVVAIDARRSRSIPDSWEVYTHGGRKGTGLDAVRWAEQMADLGAGEILLTSMDKDGTREGYDLDLTRVVSSKVEIPVVASGGVGCVDHLIEGVIAGRADAVLAASIFHYGEHTIREVKHEMKKSGIEVRD